MFKRYVAAASLLLFACYTSLAQLPKDYSSKYDKFKDLTTISRKGSIIRAAKGSKESRVAAIYFNPVLSHQGQTLQRNVQAFSLVFRSVSMLCRTWCFHGNSNLIVLADGERLHLGDGFWDGSAGSTTEIMSYTISRTDLEKLATAKVIEFQLGNFEGKFAANDSNAVKTTLELGTVK